jgi:hypothetical protein
LKNIENKLSGTPGNKKTANYIYNKWQDQGLDKVQMVSYDVLLDYTDTNSPNNIQVFDSLATIESSFEIDEIDYESINDTEVSRPYLAYAANGSVISTELYYVNYCRDSDFDFLIKNGFDVKGKIVMCKFGKIFRGNKVQFAEMYGAGGVLIFDDPSRSSEAPALNYPNGEFLPDTGAQRGTIYIGRGDPQTPDYPSNDYVFRNERLASKILPKIPAQVIGYKIAAELFKLIDKMNNISIPDSWLGDLNVTYSLGGPLKQNKTVVLNDYNQRKISRIYNVIGMIQCKTEPDRYVIIGNLKIFNES